jgi:predicted nucleic acid-binding protein
VKGVFIDCDVAIDLLARREPWFPHAARLFSLIEQRKLRGYVSPLLFANLHFILSRQSGRAAARSALQKLRLIVGIVPVTERAVDLALAAESPDFEDAVQYYAAVEARLGMIVTRNKDHYRRATLPVCSAEECLAALDAAAR